MVKRRVIALYTELTLLRKGENETTTDYIIRAETAATALKTAEEVISDGLLIAMVLKGLPRNYKTFSTVILYKKFVEHHIIKLILLRISKLSARLTQAIIRDKLQRLKHTQDICTRQLNVRARLIRATYIVTKKM